MHQGIPVLLVTQHLLEIQLVRDAQINHTPNPKILQSHQNLEKLDNEFWHLKYTDRFQREKDSLIALGATIEVDENLLIKGIVSIDCALPSGGCLSLKQPLQLRIVYPDLYPFFRPQVIAPELELPRHQNPQVKNLCLLPRDTIAWELDWTIGDLLNSQLNKVLIKGMVTDPQELEQDSEEQAEPISEYYSNVREVALFDSTIFQNLDAKGRNSQFLGKIKIGLPLKTPYPTSLVVVKLTRPTGEEVILAPDVICQNFPRSFEGSLYYIPEFIEPHQPYFLERLKLILNSSGRPLSPPRHPIRLENKIELVGVIGLAFPEETAPGKRGIGWIFFSIGKKSNKSTINFLKVLRLNRAGHELRVPKVTPLGTKTVGIIGLGAIGGPVAIELAKNGIYKLKLLDFDVIDPGTTVRWPLGISEAGNQKTDALANFIKNNYPSTNVEIFNARLGETSDGASENQSQLVERFFEGTSLIIDASTESGIHSLVAYESESKEVPYVMISATSGGFGGIVMRKIPKVTLGCFVCLQYWIGDKESPIKVPPEELTDRIQATGCGDTTFTGSSFDLSEISLAGVRMVVSALCYSEQTGYNLLPHDIGILSMVDEAGLFDYPKWEMHKLNKHPQCRSCNPTI